MRGRSNQKTERKYLWHLSALKMLFMNILWKKFIIIKEIYDFFVHLNNFSLLTCTSPDNPTTKKWDVVDSQVGSAKAHIYLCTACTCKLLFLCLLLVQAEARFGWGITQTCSRERMRKRDSTFIFPPSCLKVGTFKLKIHTWEFVRTNVNQ